MDHIDNKLEGLGSLALRVKDQRGELVDLKFLFNKDRELLSVSNPALLALWLGGNATKGGDISAVVSDEVKRDMHFFGSKPCWFSGCEELREQYRKELDAIGGSGCKGCKKGALNRKYLELVAAAQKQT